MVIVWEYIRSEAKTVQVVRDRTPPGSLGVWWWWEDRRGTALPY